MHATELGFRLPAPPVEPHEIDRLCASLRELGGWHTAKELCALGYEERHLRAIAEASDGRIITGQRGYSLIESNTPEEIDRAASWLESQGRKMLSRGAAIRRRFHRWAKQTS